MPPLLIVHILKDMNKLPRSLILELAKDQGTKQIFIDKLREAKDDLKSIQDSYHSEPQTKVAWLNDITKEIYHKAITNAERRIKKFQRYLMINTGTLPEHHKSFDLERLREVPIEEVLPPSVEVEREYGDRTSLKCPFHIENTASCIIYKNDNHFHCFGCGEHGDVIHFVMKTNDYSFKTACDYLVKMV